MNFKRSDRVWKWLDEQSMAFSKGKQERGSGLADGSVEKYKYTFHSVMNQVEEMTGKTDPMKVTPNDVYKVVDHWIEKYKDGDTGKASLLRGMDDALHAYKEASKASGVYGSEQRLGDKRIISKKVTESKVFRKANETTVKAATREEMERVVEKLRTSRSPAKETAIQVVRLQFETGKRIQAILRSKVDDFMPEKEQFQTIGDKGGKDNEVYFLNDSAHKILSEVTEGKKGGDMMFKIKYTQTKDPNKMGQDKSVGAIISQVSEAIRVAAIRAGVNDFDKKYSSHSNRKGFANEREAVYGALTEEEVDKELARRRSLDPNLDKRVDTLLDSMKKKFKIKANADKREFTYDEKVRLLVSMDINHSRLDVLRFYIMKGKI